MGLFDRFRKKDEKIAINKMLEDEKGAEVPKFYTTRDRWLNAEFYHGKTLESYDTTKLTINVSHPFILAEQKLYRCIVAWDGKGDGLLISDCETDNIQVLGKRRDYKAIWLELDLAKLQTDPDYCNVLMNQLLLKSRVNNLIENGLKENPKRPCGFYIGGVREKDGLYTKFFDVSVGETAHYSKEMRDIRTKKRREEMENNNRKIAYNNAKIEELNRENQALQKTNNYEIGE